MYEKVMNLIEEHINLGLNPDTNPRADLKMFPTYVRSLPNGTGIASSESNSPFCFVSCILNSIQIQF